MTVEFVYVNCYLTLQLPYFKSDHVVVVVVPAAVPADSEQHRGGAQLDHHLPHARQLDVALLQRRKLQAIS